MKSLNYWLGSDDYKLTHQSWPLIFYTVATLTCLYESSTLFYFPKKSIDVLWPWKLFGFEDLSAIHLATSFICLIFGFVNCTRFTTLKTRVIFAILLWLQDSLRGSFGKVDHNFIGWCWAATFVAFYWDNKSLILRIHQAQTIILFNYFLSGLWKLRAIFFGELTIWESFKNYLAFQMIQVVKAGGGQRPLIDILYQQKELLFFATCALLTLELLPFLMLREKRALCIVGGCLILFHIVNFLVLNINYTSMIFLLFVLFFLLPITKGSEV